jgi:hypothetical protein
MEIVLICNINKSQFFRIYENPFVLAQKPNKMGNFDTLFYA